MNRRTFLKRAAAFAVATGLPSSMFLPLLQKDKSKPNNIMPGFNYEEPRPLERATEHGGMLINRGWGWKWKGRQRWDGRMREYYTRTSFGTKGELSDAMAALFPNVEFIDGTPADREPTIVMVMPPESFQHGILKEIYRLNAPTVIRDVNRTLLDRCRENMAAMRKLKSLIVAAKPLPKSLIA